MSDLIYERYEEGREDADTEWRERLGKVVKRLKKEDAKSLKHGAENAGVYDFYIGRRSGLGDARQIIESAMKERA